MGAEPSLRTRRPPGLWRRVLPLACAVVAVVVALLALEAVTRVVFDRNGMHFGIEMWKYARDVKQRSAIPAMGHEHAPHRQARLMGVDVRTNSLGLREREFAQEKTPGVRRVLVLGDSMTFGWGTAVADTYPKVLEGLLNRRKARYEVINGGVGNYNTVQEVAYFRERGLRLNPDEVILGFYINDAEPIPVPTQNVLARHSYLYVLATSGWDALARRMGVKSSRSRYYEGLYGEGTPTWQACRDALADLARLCRRGGIALRIVLIPELHAPGEHYPFRRVHELVAAFARSQSVPVVDLNAAFTGIDPATLWVSRGDAHPNALAHAIIARAIHEAMASPTEE